VCPITADNIVSSLRKLYKPSGVSTNVISSMHCVALLLFNVYLPSQAMQFKFFNFEEFSVDEYEHYEVSCQYSDYVYIY